LALAGNFLIWNSFWKTRFFSTNKFRCFCSILSSQQRRCL